MDEWGGEFHGEALGEVEGARFPAEGGSNDVFGASEEVALGFGYGAGGVAAGDEEGGHVGNDGAKAGEEK